MSKEHPFRRKIRSSSRESWVERQNREALNNGPRRGDDTYGLQYENQWYDDDEVDLMAEGLFETMLLERS